MNSEYLRRTHVTKRVFPTGIELPIASTPLTYSRDISSSKRVFEMKSRGARCLDALLPRPSNLGLRNGGRNWVGGRSASGYLTIGNRWGAVRRDMVWERSRISMLSSQPPPTQIAPNLWYDLFGGTQRLGRGQRDTCVTILPRQASEIAPERVSFLRPARDHQVRNGSLNMHLKMLSPARKHSDHDEQRKRQNLMRCFDRVLSPLKPQI
eukprot:gene25909-biopygen1359